MNVDVITRINTRMAEVLDPLPPTVIWENQPNVELPEGEPFLSVSTRPNQMTPMALGTGYFQDLTGRTYVQIFTKLQSGYGEAMSYADTIMAGFRDWESPDGMVFVEVFNTEPIYDEAYHGLLVSIGWRARV